MVHAETIIEQAEAEREKMQSLLRPVAEFFHSHEGELFERYEAVDELVTDESIPSDDERTLHRVVGNLAADRVDPVQNVVRDSDKYVGVLEYEEHDFWYEYVEVDDVHGRMNVGVCAQCVKEADSDAEVAKGVGTAEELESKIRQHYSDEHSESPSEIETGATLVSGTTIAGNEAIHTGNDGAGSGLDADTVQGNDSTVFVNFGNTYSKSTISGGSVLSQFASPSGGAQGIGVDSSDSLWHADRDADSIYQLNQSGSVLSQFASPSSAPRGIGLDSSDSLWHADDSADSIYQLNQSGSVLSGFASPSVRPTGIGLDSSDSLWHADLNPDSIYQLNQSGSVLSGFASPSSSPEGIGLDSSDSLWHADSSADSIYQLNQNGSILSGFASPSVVPRGIGLDSSDSLWHADDLAGSIYQLKKKSEITYE